jgi:hypothetical protein
MQPNRRYAITGMMDFGAALKRIVSINLAGYLFCAKGGMKWDK